jgi:hypothetical protein
MSFFPCRPCSRDGPSLGAMASTISRSPQGMRLGGGFGMGMSSLRTTPARFFSEPASSGR